jgi:subtilisin family serine protease
MMPTARIKAIVCMCVAVTLLVTSVGGRHAAASKADGRFIVVYKQGTCLTCQTSLLTSLGVDVTHVLTLSNALAIDIPLNLVDYVLGLLNPSNLDFLNVINDQVAEVVDDLLTLVDPICPTPALQGPESYRWGQLQIAVPAAHEQLSGLPGSAVKVAVLDTGIDWTHLHTALGEFYQKDAGGYNALDGANPSDYNDNHGHGTHMAGIIAAALNGPGSLGIIGVAPEAELVAVKVLDSTGHGYLSDIINGLQWVYNSDIRLVNMSFGFSSDSTPLQQAIQSLYNKGVIMVAAAGNRCAAAHITEDGGGADCQGGPAATCAAPLTDITYPAAYQGRVLAVGATDIHHHVTAYGLSGPQLDVVAPGGAPQIGAPDNGQILSTNTGGLYGLGHGTSHAAAHVAGAVGLVLQLKPGFSFTQVSNLLKTTAVDLIDPSTGQPYPKEKQGEGRIDVEKMIEELLP